MSDFRFAGRWLTDRRVMTLAGDDFKAFITAGTWMVENRTDGRIGPDDIEFIPRFPRASIPRLVAAGLWAEVADGWLMVDYQETQTSKAEFEVLANARRRERDKKARRRAAQAAVPGDSPGDMSPGPTQARTGKDRKDRLETQTTSQEPPEVIDWPVAVIPNSTNETRAAS